MPASSRIRSSTVAALAAALGLAIAAPATPALAQPRAKAAKGKAKAPKKQGKKVDVAAERAKLEGTDVAAAVAAAAELGAAADPAAHEVLLDALATGLPPEVAVAALRAVGEQPAAGDATVLAFYARYRDRDVRSAALAALANVKEPAGTAALIAGLSDDDPKVRAAAAGAVAAGKLRVAAEPLLALLAKGDEPAAKALAAIADVELARVIGEQLGQVPDDLLAAALGGILLRPDFGPDAARVEVVRAIGKISGQAATSALADYVSATPESPPRASRKEAEAMVEARLGGE